MTNGVDKTQSWPWTCFTGSAHRDRTVLHCQFCGKRGHAHNFMRSKRFCSTSCARGWDWISLAHSTRAACAACDLRTLCLKCSSVLGSVAAAAVTGCGVCRNTQVLKADMTVIQSSTLLFCLWQVQCSPDEASAGSQRKQSVREAPPSPEQGGVSPWETSLTETGRDPELTTRSKHWLKSHDTNRGGHY